MQTNKPNHPFFSQIYKQLSVPWEQSIVNLLINYSRIKELKKSNLIIYFNAQAKTLQIVTSAWGMSANEMSALWNLTSNRNIWIQNAFMLGSHITLETKQKQIASSTSVDLNALEMNSSVKTLDTEKFMKAFEEGTRLTITNLHFEITKNNITELHKIIQLNLLPVLFNQDLKIIINLIDNDGIFCYDGLKFIPIKELIKTTYMSVPEIESIEKEINFEIDYKQEKIETNGFVASNYVEHGIYIYDGYQLISTITNPWTSLISKDISNQFIYLQLDNLGVNFLKTDFVWTPASKQQFNNELINALGQVAKPDDGNELETTKLYLTKAFEISGNSNQFADFEIIKNKLKFVYTADDGKQITINLFKNRKSDTNEWLQLIPVQESAIDQVYEYDVNFNVKHPYFATFDQKEAQLKIEQFIICYAIAETICRLDGSSVTKLKYEIDKILRGKL